MKGNKILKKIIAKMFLKHIYFIPFISREVLKENAFIRKMRLIRDSFVSLNKKYGKENEILKNFL